MKEKLNKNETMSSVTQLRPSTKVKHPDDCRPTNFSLSSNSFISYYSVTSLVVMVTFTIFALKVFEKPIKAGMKGKNSTFLSMFLGSFENISKPSALTEQCWSDFIKPATGSTLNSKLTNVIKIPSDMRTIKNADQKSYTLMCYYRSLLTITGIFRTTSQQR